jgi:hypothetical protein
LPAAIPDGDFVFVDLPVELEEGCDCTVANVAITFGIDHPNVRDLGMGLFSPDFTVGVLLFGGSPPSDANLVPGNLITFDDSAGGALDPRNIGSNVDGSDNILTGTYYAQGDLSNSIGAFYPDPDGLIGLFNGKVLPAAGDWTLVVDDGFFGNSGTIQSVELTITCAV